ncbi:hypothetical protein M1394_02930 [Candidatus Marsarchaeota archaeon]|nr:hypothetical protein [Candidatus Marsarchaeota archaeon]
MTFRDRKSREGNSIQDLREAQRRRDRIEEGRVTWEYYKSKLDREAKELRRKKGERTKKAFKAAGVMLLAGYMAHVTVESYSVFNKTNLLPTSILNREWNTIANVIHGTMITLDIIFVAVVIFVYKEIKRKP